jgi:uncharacterized protein YdeI (YjbR/CyaY-like superfamily)
MAAQQKRFRAVLEPLPGALGWVIARLPFDPMSSWKTMVRLRVKVTAGGQLFRTSLFPGSKDHPSQMDGYFVLVNKKMQKAAGVSVGGMIDLTIEPDLETRDVEAPAELAALFKQHKSLARWYARLSDSIRADIARTIDGVKSPEARQRRVDQMAERMLLAMEGEKVLPPILEVAFRRHPGALEGWKSMTEVQRRGHLLGVFYYQSPEAREKRAGKVVEDCLKKK